MAAPASITDVSIEIPSALEVYHVLSLQAGFNSALVVLGTTLLGVAAGIVGTFALLRKRALMGDALAHASLPGLGAAFLIAWALGYEGRNLGVLLFGATISGILGVLIIQLLSRHTRLPEDAAIGAVLSVFFGIGVTLLSIIQNLGSGSEGGLSHFIYGQTAAMNVGDLQLMLVSAAIACVSAVLLLKEFRLVCFDPEFASVQGWPVSAIDLAMMALVVMVTVIGLQAVGLILIIALLIIPAAAARFWTERLGVMCALGALFGGLSGYLGSSASALMARLPAGAIIVITAGIIFFLSFFFAPTRGVLASFIRQIRLRLRVSKEHILRALYEIVEARQSNNPTEQVIFISELAALRKWTKNSLGVLVAILAWQGLIQRRGISLQLTGEGLSEARRITRNHRLWEEYLVSFGQLAPSHVDWSADAAEHVLSEEMVEALTSALREKNLLPETDIELSSVHPISGLENQA